MPGGLAALLDDIAVLAKLAAASVDVGAAGGRARAKAAGVVIDDAAVVPRYVHGFTPNRRRERGGDVWLNEPCLPHTTFRQQAGLQQAFHLAVRCRIREPHPRGEFPHVELPVLTEEERPQQRP